MIAQTYIFPSKQLPIHELERPIDSRPGMQHTKTVFQSGMIRLSCPHLTKAIDQFEYEGTGIKKLNADLNEPAADSAADDGGKSAQCTHDSQPKLVRESYSPATKLWRQHYREINAHYKEMKNELISEEQRTKLFAKLGQRDAEEFLSSGIGGISERNENDVKCLHLHTADALLRGREANQFGAWTLEQLEKERGVDVNGCAGESLVASIFFCFLPKETPVYCFHCLNSPYLFPKYKILQIVGNNAISIFSAQMTVGGTIRPRTKRVCMRAWSREVYKRKLFVCVKKTRVRSNLRWKTQNLCSFWNYVFLFCKRWSSEILKKLIVTLRSLVLQFPYFSLLHATVKIKMKHEMSNQIEINYFLLPERPQMLKHHRPRPSSASCLCPS